MTRPASMFMGIVLALPTAAFALSPRDVFKKASPAVVLVLGGDGGGKGNGGTGSIISSDGLVITNAHVVIGASGRPYKTLYTYLKPPKVSGDAGKDLVNRYRASVVAFSPTEELDLALLQIENPPPNLPTIAFANPDHVEVGDPVVAIGHPEQGGLWTLTTGTISTVIANFNGVRGKDVFQTEASVNRGNSGGPLLDDEGNMVGINTSIARQGSGGVTITDVNFSLESSVAVKWLAGRGMGLAYAEPPKQGVVAEAEMVVALAPTVAKAAPAQEPVAAAPAQAVAKVVPKEGPITTPVPVKEAPAATIVLAEAPPERGADAAKLRDEGVSLGREKRKEKVVRGKRLDPTQAKPKIESDVRPFTYADLFRQEMQEMEDVMDDMRGKVRDKKARGMGLW